MLEYQHITRQQIRLRRPSVCGERDDIPLLERLSLNPRKICGCAVAEANITAQREHNATNSSMRTSQYTPIPGYLSALERKGC
jgi:hypothetical protein